MQKRMGSSNWTRDAPAVEAGTVGDISRIMFISIEREILQWTEREPFRLNIRIEIPIPASFGDAVSSFLDTTKDVAGLAGPLRPGGIHGHHIIVIVIGVEEHRRAELPELVQIGGHPGTGPRFVQGRQQHCRQNCDDGDNHKQLDQGESFHLRIPFHIRFANSLQSFCFFYYDTKTSICQ